MSVIKGDFLGFTFNGVHSSDLGLIRVSDGSRYNENLYPTIQDKTVQVPGGDGTYYFGSFYTQRTFNISVVFDNLSEDQFIRIKQVFGDKEVHDLIFDETPYKVYKAKITGTPNLKYVCFDKGVNRLDRDYQQNIEILNKKILYGVGAKLPSGRIYKGEGQLNFVSYSPFARSRFKYIDDYILKNIPEWGSLDTPSAEDVHENLYDWIDTIKLKRIEYTKDLDNIPRQIDLGEDIGVAVYNPGDFPVDFELTFASVNNSFYGAKINSTKSKDFNGYLILDSFNFKQQDQGIRVNTKLNLIEGVRYNEEKTEYKKVKNIKDQNPRAKHWYWLNKELNPPKFVPASSTIPVKGREYYIRIPYFEATGTIYNEYIKEGDFFKIPITEDLIWLPISSLTGTGLIGCMPYIKYNYLFY